MKRVVLLCMCLIIIAINSFAQDIINLKNGQKIEGKVLGLEVNKDYVKIKIKSLDIILTYYWSDIENIIFGRKILTNATNKIISNRYNVIKGEIKFPDYKQGYIRILIFDKADKKSRKLIGMAQIPRPGPFTLNVPPGIKKVYIGAYNDSDNDGPPYKKHDPAGWYGYPGQRKPILINKPVTNNIILKLHWPK